MNSDPFLRSGAPSRRRETRTSTPFRMTCAGVTDRGRQRETNQDRFLTAPLAADGGARGGHLLVVADGVGGCNGGERASEVAVNTIEQRLVQTLRRLDAQGMQDADAILGEMRAAFRRADARIRDEAAGDHALRGMATTLTVAACLGRRLFVAHAGDSRCYVIRSGALRRLTNDHTVTAELVRRGLLTADEAAEHRFRHVLTQCLGGSNTKLDVEVRHLELWPGDLLLLCSDGLTEMVPAHEIAATLAAEPGPEAAARALIARANLLGGRDNVTAVVARCEPDA